MGGGAIILYMYYTVKLIGEVAEKMARQAHRKKIKRLGETTGKRGNRIPNSVVIRSTVVLTFNTVSTHPCI